MITLLSLAASSLIWGAVLVGAVIALQSRGELSGRARQWLWRGAAMLLVTPWLAVPVIDVLAPGLALSLAPPPGATDGPVSEFPADVVVTSMALDAGAPEAVVADQPSIVLPWIEILVAVIVAGWLLRFGVAQFAALRMRRLLRSARPAPEGPSRDALNTWSRRLLLRRKPDLRMMDSSLSPFSSGALRPIICLPKGIEQRVRPEALGLIVGHECIHVARGDGWWRPAERAIADVLWFNPFAWTIRRELDIARELACDEAVVASSFSRRAYARTLRDVAGMVSGLSADAPATAMSISGGGRLLAMRMKRTLATAGRAPGRATIAGAILLACAAAPVAIAQALLIEAVQPPDPPPALELPPAPPAPPAPPVAETPAVPEVPAAPETPPAPPAPPADSAFATPRSVVKVTPRVPAVPPPPARVQAVPSVATPPAPPAPATAPLPPLPAPPAIVRAKAGEMLHIWFPAQVVALQADKQQGGAYSIKLVQTETTSSMEGCTALMTGLTDLRVTEKQTIASGSPVGVVGEDSHMSISCQTINATHALDGAALRAGKGVVVPRATATPAPPAAPSVRLAPLSATRVQAADLPRVNQALRSTPQLDGAPNRILETKARKTQGYGIAVDTANNRAGLHQGIDLAVRRGTPVHAPGAGVVKFAEQWGSYGKTVELELAGGHSLRFSHLDEVNVERGESIPAGHVVGKVGDDEFTTGPHLHLEYRYKSRAYDPEKVEGLNLTAPD
jgi:murein DD-endopeptidase MepM/ murein hydrolase activator NlpD/beta-lactamase regulating signal transducer with metallopeptidase domain